MEKETFDQDNTVLILKVRLSTAKSIHSQLQNDWKDLQEKLRDCLARKLANVTNLVPLCSSLIDDRSHLNNIVKSSSCSESLEEKEIRELKNAVDDQKRSIARIHNNISIIQQDISEIQDVNFDAKEIGERQLAELQSMTKREELLKEECRSLRKQLAHCRQRQWYQQNVENSVSASAYNCNKTSDETHFGGQVSSKLDCIVTGEPYNKSIQYQTAANPQGQPGSKMAAPHTPTDSPPSLSKKKKRFTYERKTPILVSLPGNADISGKLPTSGTQIDSKREQGLEVSNHEAEASDGDLPDISCDSTELDTYYSPAGHASVTLLAAIGAKASRSLPGSPSPSSASYGYAVDTDIKCVEARKEANNRHFKFFSNF